MTRPLEVQIDLNAIVANATLAKSLSPESKLLACVKANAYGHGMIEVATVLETRVDAFGVACLEEAQLLRASGIKTPILLLEGCFSRAELEEASELSCWIVLHSQPQLESYLASANKPDNLWLKLDTGMHRLGFDPRELEKVIGRLLESGGAPRLHLMTHFACADETSNDFTQLQLDRFTEVVSAFNYPTSLANSAALLAWPAARAAWNRPGFMLYGVNPLDIETTETRSLTPAMSMTSEVIAVRDLVEGEGVGYNHAWRALRDSRIAVVACGYGDGYPRQARNGTPVLVNGERAKTIGHIAMDMLTLDVTDLGPVAIGDKVELWGSNLDIAEVARHTDMSPYELMTRLPGRAPRRYLQP